MNDYGIAVQAALTAYMDNSARTVQSDEGRLGPSDVGFCRQRAALMTRGVGATDSPPKWSAAVGTAVHNYVETALKEMFPTWLMGSIDDVTVTATLPSGATISGHPDIVIPEDNTVLDIKTVDGFQWVKREGTSQQHKYQRHLYAMGCIAAGLFDKTKPVYVGNVYFDRSGKEPIPIVFVEELDPTLTDEIDSWVTDVIYAVKNNEDASRDIPSVVCQKICAHFTACRGGLQANDGVQEITDPDLVSAVNMYAEARDMAIVAEQMKDEAKDILSGISGATKDWQVRWVSVRSSRPDEQSSARIDFSRVRK